MPTLTGGFIQHILTRRTKSFSENDNNPVTSGEVYDAIQDAIKTAVAEAIKAMT